MGLATFPFISTMKNCPYYDDEFCAFHSQVWKSDEPKDKPVRMAESILQVCYNFLRGEMNEAEFGILVLSLATMLHDFEPRDVGAMFNTHALRKTTDMLVEILGRDDLSEILANEEGDEDGKPAS